MTAMPWDAQGEAQTALHTIVTDRRYGPAALSNSQTMAYLLHHMLPNSPRESSALIAASTAGVPGILQNHLSHGTDLNTACRLTASAFENQTALAPDACNWAVWALATALRLDADDTRAGSTQDAAPRGSYQPTMAARTGPGAEPGFRPGVSPGRPNGLRIAAAAVTAAGAGLIIWACALPDLRIPADSGRTSFSIFNSGVGGDLWFAVEPVGVAVLGIAAALLIVFARRSARLRSMAIGVLFGFGIQTIMLFAGYRFAFRGPDHAGPAGTVGIFGGIVLLVAALLSAFGREELAPA